MRLILMSVLAVLAAGCTPTSATSGDRYFQATYANSGWTILGETPDGYKLLVNPVSKSATSVITWDAFYRYDHDIVSKAEWDCVNNRRRDLIPVKDRITGKTSKLDKSWLDLNNSPPGSAYLKAHQKICSRFFKK